MRRVTKWSCQAARDHCNDGIHRVISLVPASMTGDVIMRAGRGSVFRRETPGRLCFGRSSSLLQPLAAKSTMRKVSFFVLLASLTAPRLSFGRRLQESSDRPSQVPSDAPSQLPSDVPSQIPSDVPSDAPSSLPTNNVAPPTYPPDRLCAPQANALMLCYADFENATACDICVADAIPPLTGDCETLGGVVCEGIEGCNCGECASAVEGYVDCAFQEYVGCSVDCEGERRFLTNLLERGVDSYSYLMMMEQSELIKRVEGMQ